MIILKANTNDAHIIQSIAKTTFTEAFSSDNSEENMQHYLSENLSLENIVKELDHPFSEFYLLKNAEKVMGYLKFNFEEAQTEIRDKNSMEIERIYILKEFYGKKAGAYLLENAIKIAREKGVKYIWLGVWEHNYRAIRFYQKNGFEVFDKHIFIMGDDHQTDWMMKLDLF